MQRFSFDPRDPYFDLHGWRAALQVITFENTYGIDPEAVTQAEDAGSFRIEAHGLRSGGGQVKHAGSAWLRATQTADGIEVRAGAETGEKIRCLKLIVDGLPYGDLAGHNWDEKPLTEVRRPLWYPLFLHAPLVFLHPPGDEYVYLHALDPLVRAKRFWGAPGTDGLRVELIHEEAATAMSNAIETPPWRLGRTRSPETVVAAHMRHLEDAHGLRPWEERTDVPAWARQIALVLTLHGMHWTGRIFNTYDDMLAAIRWAAERIEGRRVLAFLPGWEGRYYWQYGDYRPDPRLGGPAGFRRLAEGAKALGVTLMPMFGANCANATLPGFERWGEPARLHSPAGLEFQGNRPDWDASRAHDPGWQAWLNPGHPAWRHHLSEQISSLLREYGLRAAFLDTQHIWENDPLHPLFEGLSALRDDLRAQFDDMLLAGEGWYDALAAVTPVSQVGAPSRWPELFSRYSRTFAHLSWGDPSRDSTGVHELGYAPFRLVPDELYRWPTLPIVDGSLTGGAEKAEQVIAQSRTYAEKYL